jgi:DNA damage-binding protein 2
MRHLEAGSSLCSLEHKRVVNSAYFSPITGNKILTTSQDNRLRIWDSIFGNMASPSREIVHSHDFNRHLTPFKAEWDPKVAFLFNLRQLFMIFPFSFLLIL